VNECITRCPSHLLVLSASDNNEGWERRRGTFNLSLRHYPERLLRTVVPYLFPELSRDYPELVDTLLREYNHMLCFNLANAARVNCDRPATTESIIDQIESHYGDKMESYLTRLGDEELKLKATLAMRSLKFGLKDGPGVYDRNSVYEDSDGVLRPLFPRVMHLARERFPISPFTPMSKLMELAPGCDCEERFSVVAANALC
jgi:hypothetical protein